ncbi:MAG: hypothetical protein AVDCRST_MAG85-2439, partial [uncultured Solirubrobacteraceae bacterium]
EPGGPGAAGDGPPLRELRRRRGGDRGAVVAGGARRLDRGARPRRGADGDRGRPPARHGPARGAARAAAGPARGPRGASRGGADDGGGRAARTARGALRPGRRGGGRAGRRGRRRGPGTAARHRRRRPGRGHVVADEGVPVGDVSLGLLRPLEEPLGRLVRHGRVRQPREGPGLPRAPDAHPPPGL